MQAHHCSHLCTLNLSLPPHQLRRIQSRKTLPLISGKPRRLLSFASQSHPPLESAANDSDLELLGKPSPIPIPDYDSDDEADPPKPPELDEALAPFLKLFRDSPDAGGEGIELPSPVDPPRSTEMAGVRFYEPIPGDLVVGVVVSGNENRLDVNVGADALGTMLTKEVLPLYDGEMDYLLCDPERGDGGRGRIGVVRDDDALGGREKLGRPAVEVGTVLFAEVLGRTLSGRPLLSTRRMFRRVAWHRVRQIKQLNEPIEVKIYEWNTGGLLTRIEGLRAFLPKAELMNRVHNFKDLKDNVGRRIFVSISRIDEVTGDLIISEKEAWDILHLSEGTLLEGTIQKIFPFGAQVKIGETNRSGLLHISNISRARIASVSDLLKVDEKVKALVVRCMFPDKISLSIADLESEPGLFLSNKEKVFLEAEEMARRFRRRLPAVPTSRKLDALPTDLLPFDDERLYANWKWFEFERYKEVSQNEEMS